MASLGAIQGGIKSITYYKFTGLTINSTFANSMAITAVTSVAKTDIVPCGMLSEGQASTSFLWLYLDTTTSVLYAISTTDVNTNICSFKVIQYY